MFLLPGPPSAPLGLMANAPSTTAVVLSWSPPQDSGGMGTVFYTVYYQALISGSLRMTWGNATTTSVTVTNLLPATEYRMTVVAQNGLPGDEGNSSASLNVTTQSALQCKPLLVAIKLSHYPLGYTSALMNPSSTIAPAVTIHAFLHQYTSFM